MEEIDIWRSAALLLRQHGENADPHACRHMHVMIERGDPKEEAVWKHIMKAIAVLQRRAPGSPDQVH